MATKTFSSDFDPLAVTFRSQRLDALDPRVYAKSLDALMTYGFFILEVDDNDDPRAQLQVFGESFGNAILHPKSDTDGITEIKNEANQVYLSKSNEEHRLHTDCSYLQAPIANVIMLQCIAACNDGGDSLLCSGLLLYERMKKYFPDELRLLETSPIGYTCDKQAAEKLVFNHQCIKNSGNVAMTFRLDDVSSLKFPSKEVEEAYSRFGEIATYCENVLKFRLQENQTIVVDNMAVMHGRSSYGSDSGRIIHRLQLSGYPLLSMLGINTSSIPKEMKHGYSLAVSN